MAPGFTPEALAVFKAKANVRLLQIALPPGGADATGTRAATRWTSSASARAC